MGVCVCVEHVSLFVNCTLDLSKADDFFSNDGTGSEQIL